jgi:hypothetical protein
LISYQALVKAVIGYEEQLYCGKKTHCMVQVIRCDTC